MLISTNETDIGPSKRRRCRSACLLGTSERPGISAHGCFCIRRSRRQGGLLQALGTSSGKPAGHIPSFTMEGQREITYWIGRGHWGRGLATEALRQFLDVEKIRPIFARSAADNIGSCRALEKCEFQKIGIERGHAPARIWKLRNRSTTWIRPRAAELPE